MTSPATFSLYIRPTPERAWFVALGVHRVLEFLDAFGFGPQEIAYLRTVGFDEGALDWLTSFEPSGEIWGVADGTIVLADEPILEFTAPLPIAQLVETAVINLVQLPTLVATKAARIALAAGGRPVVDFGFRRAQGLETGVEAALAAYIGGGLTTSNMEAGRRYGIPVVGTMAHSFVQAHTGELEAFRAFAGDHADNTVLLVDTYDTLQGVRNAIVVADEMKARGEGLRGVRLDSGDLFALSLETRRMLDDAGHHEVLIFGSGGLNEAKIADLVGRGAPIDAYGVGTDLVVSTDRPALDIAYKLVAYDDRPAAKFSPEKSTWPGAKQVFRDGTPARDVLGLRSEDLRGRALLEPVWRDGRVLQKFDMHEARERVASALADLPEGWKRPDYFTPPRPRPSDGLRGLSETLRSDHLG
jgi:nicotinate phosphoribosyltransferase